MFPTSSTCGCLSLSFVPELEAPEAGLASIDSKYCGDKVTEKIIFTFALAENRSGEKNVG